METKLFSKQSSKLISGARWKTFTRQEKVILPIVHIFLAIMAAWVILPIVFVLINSFKTVHVFNGIYVKLSQHNRITNVYEQHYIFYYFFFGKYSFINYGCICNCKV